MDKNLFGKFIESGTETRYQIDKQYGKKMFYITMAGIKVCKLNNNAREITFENTAGLRSNRFQDMCEDTIKLVRKYKYKYSLYDYKENKIVYLVSPEQSRNTVREKTYYPIAQLSNKAIKEMELGEILPI